MKIAAIFLVGSCLRVRKYQKPKITEDIPFSKCFVRQSDVPFGIRRFHSYIAFLVWLYCPKNVKYPFSFKTPLLSVV